MIKLTESQKAAIADLKDAIAQIQREADESTELYESLPMAALDIIDNNLPAVDDEYQLVAEALSQYTSFLTEFFKQAEEDHDKAEESHQIVISFGTYSVSFRPVPPVVGNLDELLNDYLEYLS